MWERRYWRDMPVMSPEDAIRRQIGWLDGAIAAADKEIAQLEDKKRERQNFIADLAVFEAALAKLESA